jgi:hypothetical protein
MRIVFVIGSWDYTIDSEKMDAPNGLLGARHLAYPAPLRRLRAIQLQTINNARVP